MAKEKEKAKVIDINEGHKKDGFLVNVVQSLLRRLGSSQGVFGISPDGKRDFNALYGYGVDLTYPDYFGMYERGGLANAVVSKLPKACWNDMPKVMVDDKEVLEDEMKQLKKAGFFKAIERADILNRIGDYSVLLIGVPDGQDLDKPVGRARNISDLYFNPYNFDAITIRKEDIDPASVRFGLPEIYQINTDTETSTVSLRVHWSRIIHLAEGALDNVTNGCSALEAPWNALTDLQKVRGGSGEAYFRNARQQRALIAEKDSKFATDDTAVAALKTQIEDFDNTWSSTLRLQNMKVEHLQTNLISPRDTFDIIVEEISGQTGIPIRILTGKGAGQLAGSEDRATWNGLVSDRQISECDGWMMRCLDILDEIGALTLPENVTLEWPVLAALNEKEASEVNKNKSETLNTIVELLAKPVGDEMKREDVFLAVGLEDIEVDDTPLDDDDLDDDLNTDHDEENGNLK